MGLLSHINFLQTADKTSSWHTVITQEMLDIIIIIAMWTLKNHLDKTTDIERYLKYIFEINKLSESIDNITIFFFFVKEEKRENR